MNARISAGPGANDGKARPRLSLEPLTDGFGPITGMRIRGAVRKFVEPHLQGWLKIIPLEEGKTIAVSGQEGLYLTYRGLKNGGSAFEIPTEDVLLKPFGHVLKGLRYDIFVGQYWTRASVQNVFTRASVWQAQFAAVSGMQAVELLIFDKRKEVVYPNWISLGPNKDMEVAQSQRQSALAPWKKTIPESSMKSATRPSLSASLMPLSFAQPSDASQETRALLSEEEAVRLVTRKLKDKLRLEALARPSLITGGRQEIPVGGSRLRFSRMDAVVFLEFNREGRPVAEAVDLSKARDGKLFRLRHGFKAAFSAFQMERTANSAYFAVVASVFTPSGEHYASYVIGAK
jgi:hypothetical protein